MSPQEPISLPRSPSETSSTITLVPESKSEAVVNKSGRFAAVTAKVRNIVGETRSFFRDMLVRVQDRFQAGFHTAMNYSQRGREALSNLINQARAFLSNLVKSKENNQ